MPNLLELAIQRYKRIFENSIKVRQLPQQKTEAWISVSALNRMSGLSMPVSVKFKKGTKRVNSTTILFIQQRRSNNIIRLILFISIFKVRKDLTYSHNQNYQTNYI